MIAKLLIVFIGMLFGGMVAESFKIDPNFWVVAERSFFEGWALLTYWLMEKFMWKGEDV